MSEIYFLLLSHNGNFQVGFSNHFKLEGQAVDYVRATMPLGSNDWVFKLHPGGNLAYSLDDLQCLQAFIAFVGPAFNDTAYWRTIKPGNIFKAAMTSDGKVEITKIDKEYEKAVR